MVSGTDEGHTVSTTTLYMLIEYPSSYPNVASQQQRKYTFLIVIEAKICRPDFDFFELLYIIYIEMFSAQVQ